MNDTTWLGQQLEAERKARGLGLTEFALAIGVDHAIVSKLINGKQRSASRANIRKLAAAIRVPPSDLHDRIEQEETDRQPRRDAPLGPTSDIYAFIELAAQRAAERTAQEMFQQMTKAPDRVPAAGDAREQQVLMHINAILALMTRAEVEEAHEGHREERRAARRINSKES